MICAALPRVSPLCGMEDLDTVSGPEGSVCRFDNRAFLPDRSTA
jgi:hypothetical protein